MPMGRADRLFRIVQRLRRRGATTARQLAEALEVSERTVYRGVRDLLSSGHVKARLLMAAEERAIKNVQSHTTK